MKSFHINRSCERRSMIRTTKRLFASVLLGTAMMGFTTPTFAIPIAGTYNFTSSILTGSFTSDGAKLTDWNFTTRPTTITFFNLTPNTTILFNNQNRFGQRNPASPFAEIEIFWNGTNTTNLQNRVERTVIVPPGVPEFRTRVNLNGTATRVQVSPIPEPTTLLLTATGLLALAGYRWRQRRGQGVQVG